MSFSMTKNFRKILSLMLVLCTVCAMLTGCFSKKEPAETEDTSPAPGLNLNLDNNPPTEAPTTEPTEPQPVINEKTGVALSQINVRSTPSQEALIIGTLAAGERIEVSRRETMAGIDWAYITTPMAGWVVMDYVKMDMEQENTGPDTSTPAGNGTVTAPTENSSSDVSVPGTITANGLNVRSEPSTNGKIQGTYNKGDAVTILETRNGWGRTSKGWIKMDYVSLNGSNAPTNNNTNTSTGNANITGNGSTTVQLRGIVTASELNLRASGSQSGDRLGSLKYGARVEILERSGNWGRTKDGWISLDYIYQDGTSGKNTATGTVTGNGLNIRSGPGTNYGAVGSYNSGDRVNILEQFTYGNTTWGCTDKGWISMAFVDVDGGSTNTNTNTGTNNTTSTSKVPGSGVITGSGVNIRAGAGKTFGVVGSYNKGEPVYITETTTVEGVTWGKTDKGWVSMAYVQMS